MRNILLSLLLIGLTAHASEDVRISIADGIELAGTLTVPEGEGPFPAAILLSVAGPADRNQTVGNHAGFRVLADHLAGQGVAVLRTDDRGVGDSSGNYFEASWDTLAGDAVTMASWLRSDTRIAPAHIGFIGMSQGAAIGAMAAKRADAAFVVMLSPPGLSGVDALSKQLDSTLALSGIVGSQAEAYRKLFAEFVDVVRDTQPEGATRLRTFLQGPGAALVSAYGFVPRDLDAQVAMFRSPWYRSNLTFDPRVAYAQVDTPVLVIGGGRDPVAPPGVHLPAVKAALPQQLDVQAHVIPDGNHLLQASETGVPQEYAKLDNAIHPRVLGLIASWLVAGCNPGDY